MIPFFYYRFILIIPQILKFVLFLNSYPSIYHEQIIDYTIEKSNVSRLKASFSTKKCTADPKLMMSSIKLLDFRQAITLLQLWEASKITFFFFYRTTRDQIRIHFFVFVLVWWCFDGFVFA